MITYLHGKIIELTEASISLDVHDVGYEVLSPRPLGHKIGDELTLYTYEAFTQDDQYLVGFETKPEREAFLSLLKVKGIGPKTALGALRATTPENLFKAIESNNTSYLKKLPGIGAKAAAQIILDLKGHLSSPSSKGNSKQYDEVSAALKSLGFKSKAVEDTLASINEPEATNEEILRMALRKLNKVGTN